MPYKTTLRVPDKQAKAIDRVAERLGLSRGETIRYLITSGLTVEQYRGASVESAEGTRTLATLAELEMEEAWKVRGLVTPGLDDINVSSLDPSNPRKGEPPTTDRGVTFTTGGRR